MVGAAISLMLALAWGGTHYPWSSWRIVGLLAASATLWALFAIRLLMAREPFIPLAILHGRVTSTITCGAFFSIGTIIGVTIYTPLYCQTVLGVSASLSGLALIAFMGGATLGFAGHRPADGALDALHAGADGGADHRSDGARRSRRSIRRATRSPKWCCSSSRSVAASGRCIRFQRSSCRTRSSRISSAPRPAR